MEVTFSCAVGNLSRSPITFNGAREEHFDCVPKRDFIKQLSDPYSQDSVKPNLSGGKITHRNY